VALALNQGIGAAGLLWAAQYFTQASWAFYRARIRLVEVSWMQMATATLPILAAVLAIKLGVGLNGFFLSQAAAWIGVGTYSLVAATRGPEALHFKPRWHSAELVETLGFARWAILLQVGFTVQSYVDRFFAAPLGGTAVSMFGTATSLSLRIVSALGLVTTLITPAISKLHSEHGLDRAARAHGLAMRATFWMGAALFVPLAAGGPALLGRWMNPAWELGSQGWFVLVCIGGFWASLVSAFQGTLLGLGRARIVGLTSFMALGAGALVAWAFRTQGLWAVASFGAVTAGVSLLCKAAWLHGRVLQRARFGEMLAASALILLVGWALRRWQWATLLGQSFLACLCALALASAGILLLGAAWDSVLSRRQDRDSLVAILLQRWGRQA
jgi:O-antigen/teichoic acid export membrane protein